MVKRIVTRIVWHFCEGIPVPVLPVEKRWFKTRPYLLHGVIGELTNKKGSLWFDIRRQDGEYKHYFQNNSFWIDLFKEELDKKIFTAVWLDSNNSFRNHFCCGHLCLEFEPTKNDNFPGKFFNDKDFLDTALDRSVMVFKRLEVEVKRYPLIGKVLRQDGADQALYRYGHALDRNGLSY